MNKRATFSPILMELIVVILFFGLTMSIVLRLAATADRISRESSGAAEALLAAETAMEALKADPKGDGAFDANNRRTETRTDDGIILRCTVTESERETGALYTLTVTATAAGAAPITLESARYLAASEVTE